MTEHEDLLARTKECEELKMKVATLEERSRQEEKAKELATKEIDRRLEGMNELRDQINQERGKYTTKEYGEGTRDLVAALDKRVQAMENSDTANRRFVAILITIATIVISILVAFANNLI
jgi:CHASE3 domain sensor protein